MKREGTATPVLAAVGSSKLDKSKLQASSDGSYGWVGAVSTVGVSGGRWYHEVLTEQGSDGNLIIGFCLSAQDLELEQIGRNVRTCGWDGNQKLFGGKSEPFGSGWKNGDVIGVTVDFDSRKIYFHRNGKLVGSMTDFPAAMLYPAVSFRRGQRCTFNFGGTNFRHPDVLACHYSASLAPKQKTALIKLFTHYQKLGALADSSGGSGDDDSIKPDGVFQFATDIGSTDDADPLFLVVAHRLRCEHPWEFTKEEWMNWALFGAHDIVTIKELAAQWKRLVFEDPELFKQLYCFVFDYLREDRKILSIDEVKTLWNMLGLEKRWKLWKQWLDFVLTKKKREYLSRDEFFVVLTFAQEHNENVNNYDPDGPWPVLVDDFVSHLNGEDQDE